MKTLIIDDKKIQYSLEKKNITCPGKKNGLPNWILSWTVDGYQFQDRIFKLLGKYNNDHNYMYTSKLHNMIEYLIRNFSKTI